MKLNNRIMGFGYVCELTEELDRLTNLTNEAHYDFFRHYILIDSYHKDERCLPIRVPGETVGTVFVSDNNVITKIVVTGHLIIYPKDINELIQKFVGIVIEY